MKLKATHLSETMRGGKMLAHVTLELAIEDLPEMLGGLDVSELNEASVIQALDAAMARRRAIEAETPVSAPASESAPTDGEGENK